MPTQATDAAGQPAQQPTTLPLIGQPWLGQGGIFATLAASPDGLQHQALILATEAPPERMTWKQATAWAESLTVDGHSDFTLPTREEGRLLWATLRSEFDLDDWYWLGTQYSTTSAWCQTFHDGYQLDNDKSDKFKVRAVRRLPLNPLILTNLVQAA